MLAPIVRATAEQYPEVEITVLSQERMADLFACMPDNVRFHGVDIHQTSLREIAGGLDRYDYVADMHGVWRSRYIRIKMALRGARVRTIHKGRINKFLLAHGMVHKPLKTTTVRYTDVLQKLGFPLLYSEASCIMPQHTGGNGIGVAPFAAHQGKIYPVERMEKVIEMLIEKCPECKIILFGGGGKEREQMTAWSEKFSNVVLASEEVKERGLSYDNPLKNELEIMKTLDVMVSMDSGNMHMASLVGTRVVSIWGATHPWAGFLGWGQSEADCVQRHDLKCRPCSIYGNKPCLRGDMECMNISEEEIVERILRS